MCIYIYIYMYIYIYIYIYTYIPTCPEAFCDIFVAPWPERAPRRSATRPQHLSVSPARP